jgi:hypothetical protein
LLGQNRYVNYLNDICVKWFILVDFKYSKVFMF